jgi:hypothetical protein
MIFTPATAFCPPPNLVPNRFPAVKRYAVRKNLCKALFANPFAKMNKIARVAWKLMRGKYAAAEAQKSVDATQLFVLILLIFGRINRL